MSETPANLPEAWKWLRQGRREETALGLPTFPLTTATRHGPVRAALGGQSEPRILLPLSHGERRPAMPATPALMIEDQRFDVSGARSRFLDLRCLRPELEVVFAEFCEAVLLRVREGALCADAVRSALSEFRALLMPQRGKEIADGTLCGLVGELIALERFVQRDPEAVAWWRGPWEDRHDFRNGLDAVEVKSSMRAAKRLVKINQLDQLAEPAGGSLHLVHFGLEPRPKAPLCVRTLVRAVLDLGGDEEALMKGLEALGCLDPAAEEWNRLSFTLAKETVYRVEPGFPRITEAEFAAGAIPAGIQSASYDLDLSAAEAWRVDGDGFEIASQRLCG